MKSIITLLFSLLLVATAMAQDVESQIKDPKAQEKIRAARIAYITEKLGLTPAEAEKFWPIYNEFDQKRRELRLQNRDFRKNPDPAKSQEEMEKAAIAQQHQLRQKELDLEKDYSNKLLNVISAKKVMELQRTEKDFRNLLLRRMQQQQAVREQRQLQRDRKDQRLKNN